MTARQALSGVDDATESTGGLPREKGAVQAFSTDTQQLWHMLYDKHRLAVFRYLRWRSHSPQDAEDMTQAVYLEAAVVRHRLSQERRQEFNINDQAGKRWLIAIARNISMREQGRRWKESPADDAVLAVQIDPNLTPDELMALNDRQRRVCAILTMLLDRGKLSADDRDVLLLHLGVGLTHEDIAMILSQAGGRHVSPVAARKRYSRAFEKVRTVVAKEEEQSYVFA